MKEEIAEKNIFNGYTSCPCGHTSGLNMHRVHRGFFVKLFLGWLPVQKYTCYGCKRSMYVKVKKDEAVTSA